MYPRPAIKTAYARQSFNFREFWKASRQLYYYTAVPVPTYYRNNDSILQNHPFWTNGFERRCIIHKYSIINTCIKARVMGISKFVIYWIYNKWLYIINKLLYLWSTHDCSLLRNKNIHHKIWPELLSPVPFFFHLIYFI